MRALGFVAAVTAILATAACGDKEVDASGDGGQGEDCDPAATDACEDGLVCEVAGDPADDGAYVCAVPLEIRGVVIDALDRMPIEGALVAALDETGAPVSDVARTDVDGAYVLAVAARRTEDGTFADALRWTLFATADGHQPFPGGIRPALPIDAADAAREDDESTFVIENPTTDVALLPLPMDRRTGRTIAGTVRADEPGGTLVVAEDGAHAPYAIADPSGAYTLFDVPVGAVTIVGYRRGLSLAPATVQGDGDADGVDLEASSEDVDALATVGGSIEIVNASGGSKTSVVLVPASVFVPALERGPVPLGLRAPPPPLLPDVAGGFEIRGVPPGRYLVLAAFENDDLVRDPDTGIGGTEIPEIEVGDAPVDAGGFKVTQALQVQGPGAEMPELVTEGPTFVFADDSSEDYYALQVHDAFGDLVWEVPDVPRVTGDAVVQVRYEGPALVSGMYYRFRATSVRDRNDGPTPISRTEDLRGVFIAP